MSVKLEVPPGFTKPLNKIVHKGIINAIDDTCMQDHESKDVDKLICGKRRSLRERTPSNLFVSTHFLPSPPGSGRPSKHRSDESSASESLRRRPGRPRKLISDEAPAVSPPAPPSGSTGDVSVQVSATRNSLEPVVSPPKTPLGSTSDRPLKVEEERESNPLLRLKKPPKTKHTPQMLDEELKKVIHKVEYLLVQKLLSSGNDVDSMVHHANTTFTYLKGFGVEYESFYRDVTEYIKHCYNLHDAEKEETVLSFSVWGGNYLNAMRNANDAEEVMVRAQGEHEKVKEKIGTLKRQLEDLKQELAHIEHEDERLKRDIIKYREAHDVAEAKRLELGTQLEAAQAKLREIKQRKNAALVGIECTTQRLESTYR
ncbi:uncharacterized protein LOC107864977 isoform X6 [Capsicum annuum]|uniref:uncharacterized protein LOC107864977 isoform X6 n=1 Tax=Capsicum annuum TaxID=4072 RepID=UPI0007BF0350|nr:uncharacterized protein LOC107864977 isoform X6 [Capsicum annuum]